MDNVALDLNKVILNKEANNYVDAKRTKYRRPHRLSYEGKAKGQNLMINGEYGLVAQQGAYITARQIEASRVAMTRYMRRLGKVWINIFPHLSRTKNLLK